MAGRPLLGKPGTSGRGWTWRACGLRASPMTMDAPTKEILARIDGEAMLEQVLDWAAVNSGTANLAGLATMAEKLGAAFARLPGEVELVEPAAVTAIAADGSEFAKPHGHHMVLRVRPEADRRVVLTGHMDTVFPVDHGVPGGRMARRRDAQRPRHRRHEGRALRAAPRAAGLRAERAGRRTARLRRDDQFRRGDRQPRQPRADRRARARANTPR
jgi:hypothetical protein